MSKLKKAAIVSAVIFFVCAIASVMLLPMTFKNAIDLYNETSNLPAQIEETQLSPNIKHLKVNFYNYGWQTVIRKSPDDKVHIKIVKGGFHEVALKVYEEGEVATLEFVGESTKKITKETFLRSMHYNIQVTIEIPNTVEMVESNRSHLLDYYNQSNTVASSGNASQINSLRNKLRSELANLEVLRIEMVQRAWDMDYYQSVVSQSYDLISDIRLQLIEQARITHYKNAPDAQIDMVAYRLTELEQSLDFCNAKIVNLQTMLSQGQIARDQFNQMTSVEKQKIARIEPEIESLQQEFDAYVLNMPIPNVPVIAPQDGPSEAPSQGLPTPESSQSEVESSSEMPSAPQSSQAPQAPSSAPSSSIAPQAPQASSSSTSAVPPQSSGAVPVGKNIVERKGTLNNQL